MFLYCFFYVRFFLIVFSVPPPSDNRIAVSNNNIINKCKFDVIRWMVIVPDKRYTSFLGVVLGIWWWGRSQVLAVRHFRITHYRVTTKFRTASEKLYCYWMLKISKRFWNSWQSFQKKAFVSFGGVLGTLSVSSWGISWKSNDIKSSDYEVWGIS
jgi:hypothetical protein